MTSSQQLDCEFYTTFYEDLAGSLDPSNVIAVNEHYLSVGKDQGRVMNQYELNRLLASIMHFDNEVYSRANLCWDLTRNLKECFNSEEWVDHFYGKEGNLYCVSRFRIANNNDLKQISNKWESIYNAIFDQIAFKPMFYKSFYNIPAHINNMRDLKLHWLKRGMFHGQKPSMKYMDESKSVIGDVQAILINKFGLDMAVLESNKHIMMSYASANNLIIPEQLVDETSLLIFLLLNTGYQLRLFFNNSELDNYKSSKIAQYDAAIMAIKLLKQDEAIAASSKKYDLESVALAKTAPLDGLTTPIIREAFSTICSTLNIIKISNSVVVDCFKQIHKQDDLAQLIPLMVKHEMHNCVEPVLNSMEIKILVASLVYNLFLTDKADKKAYLELVKEKSQQILSAMFSESGMTDFEDVLSKDIDYIIDNKKIVKLCYAKNLAACAMVEAMMLTM